MSAQQTSLFKFFYENNTWHMQSKATGRVYTVDQVVVAAPRIYAGQEHLQGYVVAAHGLDPEQMETAPACDKHSIFRPRSAYKGVTLMPDGTEQDYDWNG